MLKKKNVNVVSQDALVDNVTRSLLILRNRVRYPFRFSYVSEIRDNQLAGSHIQKHHDQNIFFFSLIAFRSLNKREARHQRSSETLVTSEKRGGFLLCTQVAPFHSNRV